MMKKRGINPKKETDENTVNTVGHEVEGESESLDNDEEVAKSSQRQSKRPRKAIVYDGIGDEDNDDGSFDESKKKPARKTNNTSSQSSESSSASNRGMSKRDSGETTLDDYDLNGDDDGEEAQENVDDGIVRDPSTSEAGQILLITVENFMCHRKLSVNFCRNVNFVTGQNGSGKF